MPHDCGATAAPAAARLPASGSGWKRSVAVGATNKGPDRQQHRLGRQHEQVEHCEIAEPVRVTLRRWVHRIGQREANELRKAADVHRDQAAQEEAIGV